MMKNFTKYAKIKLINMYLKKQHKKGAALFPILSFDYDVLVNQFAAELIVH